MSRVLTLKNLKQLAFVVALTLGTLALVRYGILGTAHAQMIDLGDSPQNIQDATGGEPNFRVLARTIINYFLYFLGFIATIMIIYAGILYVTAGGADDKVGIAKKILTYAAVGIIVILLAFAITNTILQAGIGAPPAV